MRIGPKPTLTGIFYAYKVVAEYQQELKTKEQTPGHAEHYLDKYIKLLVYSSAENDDCPPKTNQFAYTTEKKRVETL